MKILCNDQRVELPAESTVLDCLRAAGAEGAVLAAMRGGQVLALNEPLRESCALTPITMDDEEGRRIYERSLRMIMLLAARRPRWGREVGMAVILPVLVSRIGDVFAPLDVNLTHRPPPRRQSRSPLGRGKCGGSSWPWSWQ